MYADWLDGTARLLRLSAVGQARPVTRSLEADADHQAVRFIKYCALFGTTIALTEPQIIDSPVIASLFVDPQFRDFLRVVGANDPRLFELVVHPLKNDDPYKAPLHSLLTAKRQSTPLHNPMELVHIAEQLLGASSLEDRAWDLIRTAPLRRDALMVEGSLRALLYFRSRPNAIARPRAPTRGEYYKLLKSMTPPAWCEQHVAEVVQTLERMDEPARYSRTRLLEQLELRGLAIDRPGVGQALYSTVVSAWNHVVQSAVADEGSTAFLPAGVPVPFLFGRVNDVWDPGTVVPKRAALDGFKKRAARVVAGFLRMDPTALDWSQIQQLCERTQATRAELADARRSSNIYYRQEAMLRHYEAVATNLPEVESWVRGCVYLGVTGGVGLVTGGLGALGAFAVLVLQGAADWDLDVRLLNRFRRKGAISTLRSLHPSKEKVSQSS